MAVSAEAAELGIRRGMTLTQARALCANVAHAGHDPDRDQKALETLGRWMMRFSPVVACGTSCQPMSSKKPHGLAARGTTEEPPDSIFLDLTGNERLFNGLENIVAQVSDSLSRLRISANVAVAPTPGAAWALAFAGQHRRIVPPELLEKALAPLPVSALRLDEEIVSALNHLGLGTIGQVMHLPREVLPSRFGSILLRRVDEALGLIPEPLVPLQYQEKVEARMDWDGAVNSLEAIWMVFQKLIGRVIEQLVRRGQGARQVRFELLRAHAPPVEKTILLSRPSRDPVNLFNLFRCALEDLELPLRERPRSRLRGRKPGAPVRQTQICDEGFCGLRITVPLCERLSDEQISLLGHEQYAGQAELDRLIERLRIRLGNEAIVQTELVESHVPEEAWRNSSDGMTNDGTKSCGTAAPGCVPPKAEGRSSVGARLRPAGRTQPGAAVPQEHSGGSLCHNTPFRHSRPLHLLSRPIEVRVMVTPSEDLEGNPAAFTHEGATWRVAHWIGPERIAGRWWDGHDKTRDYFDIADPAGRRFWIFRVAQTGKWYLHGTFE